MKTILTRLLVGTGLGIAMLFAGGCQSGGHSETGSAHPAGAAVTYPTPPTEASQAATSPSEALARLRAGNARFIAGHPWPRNFSTEIRATASGQYPFAVILSCVDSRQPVEVIFDQGIGDVFSARVAGNVLNEDILGSIEFACKVSGAKLIAVVGHSECGAIKGAIDNAQLGSLTGLLARIQPAIGQVPSNVQPRTAKNNRFVQEVAEANVRLVEQQIRERSPVLREMLDAGKIGLVGGMYDVSTGQVRFSTLEQALK